MLNDSFTWFLNFIQLHYFSDRRFCNTKFLSPDTIFGRSVNNGKTNNIILSSQKGKNIKN